MSNSDEQLEDLFEHAPCGYLSLDAHGRIDRANATFCTWMEFSKPEILGKRFHELLTIAGRIYHETHFAPLLRMQGFFNEVALDLIKKSGQRVSVLVNAKEIRDPAGQPQSVRVIIFEATDRRRYERELLSARAEAESASIKLQELNATLESRISEAVAQRLQAEESLRHSQKMEAIGRLTGGVAHDFNNLLTVILGGLDAIKRQQEQQPENMQTARIRRAREMAAHGARRAATLTARLLALSRQQPLEFQSVAINKLLSGITDLLERTLGETIQFEVVGAAGLWDADVDPGELENVLINLAVNARDAMPSGGRLTIETSNSYLDENYVAAQTESVAAGQYVLIAVSDTGEGMDETTLARVFEPFFTTKDVGKGTGLGLAQAHGFVRQSNGHIQIYSEVDQGTTVKIYLPRTTKAVSSATTPLPDSIQAEGGTETILVVEDDEQLRAFSTSILRELGYDVVDARSGHAALDVLQNRSDVALLFTDFVLPDGMNGDQLAKEARQLRPHLKVLFTTGYAPNASLLHGRLVSGTQFIGKPFTYNDLAKKCRLLLDQE